METYQINVRFWDRHIQGCVQKFYDHFDVFFQDEEILQAFGGLISFDADKKLRNAKQTSAVDKDRFSLTEESQLQSLI